MARAGRRLGWQGWYWALVPALALAAYAPVLRIGFLADDFLLLQRVAQTGLTWRDLLPDPTWFFYRPVGVFLTWGLGWEVWGFHPWPYHLISLLLFAATALLLALWVAAVTGQRGLGWLAGTFFAVFPLHTEVAGWLAAQWDAWAACFALTALWLFTRWWRASGQWAVGSDQGLGVRDWGLGTWEQQSAVSNQQLAQNTENALHNTRDSVLGTRYSALAGAVACYALAVFSKESVFPLLPVFALSAWLVTLRFDRRAGGRLIGALLPFAAVLGANLGLRIATWGSVGGYATPPPDPAHLWDGFLAYLGLLLAPINRTVFDPGVAEAVQALVSLGLLVGLIWYGRSRRRLLLVAGAWIVLTLLPALNLGLGRDDLQNNRFLYLAAAGYCTAAAALVYGALAHARRWRPLAGAALAGLLVASAAACWVQLEPWHTSTLIVQQLDQELSQVIPPHPRRQGMRWVVPEPPDNYKGAYLLRLGISGMRYFTSDDAPWIDLVPDISNGPLLDDQRDSYALRFGYDATEARFHVVEAGGVTRDAPPPAGAEVGRDLLLWDFRDCAADALTRWQPYQAQTACTPGKGLLLTPVGADPQLLGPDLAVHLAGERFVRLRVAVSYPRATPVTGPITQWFWRDPAGSFAGPQSRTLPIKQDGATHLYWVFVPAADAGATLAQLRFDPANGPIPSQIAWIALDLVP